MTDPAASPREHSVKTPNGTVFVTEIPGEDPPLVLMHGFPDDHHIYDRLLPMLNPRRAVAFDWRGYGRSGRSEGGGFSLAEHVGELDAILDQLDIERAVLVGHDASGPDAVAFTIAHPQRVVHLVLLNTIFGHSPSLKLPDMIRLLADPALTGLADAMMNDEAQRLWLLQLTADNWGMDAGDPEGIAVTSVASILRRCRSPRRPRCHSGLDGLPVRFPERGGQPRR
jgi:pimeloyl-ACP methyl ester carboxylesterase